MFDSDGQTQVGEGEQWTLITLRAETRRLRLSRHKLDRPGPPPRRRAFYYLPIMLDIEANYHVHGQPFYDRFASVDTDD